MAKLALRFEDIPAAIGLVGPSLSAQIAKLETCVVNARDSSGFVESLMQRMMR